MKKAKTTLNPGEGIARVLCVTSASNFYEAMPSEVANAAIPSTVVGALASKHTLEENSNPAFTVNNRGAAELYQAQMGGYMFFRKDGKVYAAKLNGSTWDKFADATPITAAVEAACETMIHVPDCHFLGENKTLNFGGLVPIDGGHVFGSPHWVGAYLMSVDGGGVGHSRPNVAPGHSKTMSAFWNCAQQLGTQWGLANYGFHCLINALFQARYGSLNSQEVIGAGFQHSNWQACRDVPMGLCKALGDGSGKVFYTDATIGDQYPVKLFGFEDLWGKLWEFRPGIRFEMRDDVRYAIVYDGNIVSNTAEGREFVCALSSQSGSGTYAKSMELGEYWDMICQAVGAGSNTYYCDGYWFATGGQLLFVGGAAYNGARCGLSYAYSNYGFSLSDTRLGARLAFYGEPIFVSGAELVAMISA